MHSNNVTVFKQVLVTKNWNIVIIPYCCIEWTISGFFLGGADSGGPIINPPLYDNLTKVPTTDHIGGSTWSIQKTLRQLLGLTLQDQVPCLLAQDLFLQLLPRAVPSSLPWGQATFRRQQVMCSHPAVAGSPMHHVAFPSPWELTERWCNKQQMVHLWEALALGVCAYT